MILVIVKEDIVFFSTNKHVHGVLLIDKPCGLSFNHVVQKIKNVVC